MTEKKKRRRRSTFATALAQAKKRLELAQKELEAAQKLVAALSVEIPLLRHTAEALERQLNPPNLPAAVVPKVEDVRFNPDFQAQVTAIDTNNLSEDDL